MSFGYITDLPRFNTYAEALAFFNKTKGMRNREHIKPLKSSRRCPDDYRIAKRLDGGIECWLYRTPVLIYYPTHMVINTWDSRTTCSFVDNIAPSWLWAYMYKDTQIISVCGQMENGVSGSFVGPVVEVSVDSVYRPIQGGVKSSALEKIVLNKQRATESRKQCKDVIELARVTSKMDGYWNALRSSTEPIEERAMEWLKNVLTMNGYYAHERWDGSITHTGFGTWGCRTPEELLPKLKQRMYKMMYAEDGCYDYIPAEYGVVPKEWRTAR